MKPFRGPAQFSALLFHLWTVWTTSTVKGQATGDLRLVDSPDEYSGTLEYFASGAWGRVCPAGWDAQSIAVACRQLGFTGGVSAFSNVDEIMVTWTATPIFNSIQGITCNGTESRLMECTLDSGNDGGCSNVGFLGIGCTNHSEGDVRLTDNGGSAGIVEVYTAGDWHPVCADNAWDAMTVNRLCIDLGHTSGTVETARPLLLNTVIRTNVSCTADSGHLSECLPDNLVLSSSSDCLSNSVLTVACEATTGDLRLLGGPQPNVGQLEMWFNGEWAAPCASEWSSQAATIACPELGFADVSSWFSTALETFVISEPSGRGGAVSLACLGPNTNVINCQTSAGTCQPNERVILVCEGTTLEPQLSTSSIEASASEINVTYSLRGANMISNAARADHDRLRSLTLTYNLRSVMDTFSPETVSAQAVSRVGSQIVATFPVSATEELQPFLVYEMEMSLAVRGEVGPLSNPMIFIRGLEAEVTVELSATTARFSWPLVTSAQVPVLGYTIAIEAVDPPGLISIAPVSTLPQQNSYLQSELEEGVRYRYLLHVTPALQQDRLVVSQHEGEFTTDTAAPTGTPQEVVIEQITSAAATISWQAPILIDQNGEITHYVITYQPLGSSNQMEEFVMSVPGNELPANFTYNHMLQGLVSGTEYSVQVAAATAGGTGPSIRRSFNTSVPPSPPVAVTVSGVGPFSATVSWQPPLEDGGAVGPLMYTVTLTNTSDSNTFKFNPTAALTINLANLRHSVTYRVQVVAGNEAGMGPAAEVMLRTNDTVPTMSGVEAKVLTLDTVQVDVTVSDDGGQPVLEYTVIVGNKEERVSAGPVMQVSGLSLTAGANYGIGVVARNNIGDSKTFVGAFSVPTSSSLPSYHNLEAMVIVFGVALFIFILLLVLAIVIAALLYASKRKLMLSSVDHVGTVDDIGNGYSVQYDEVQPRAFPQPRHTQPPSLPPVEERGRAGSISHVVLEDNPAYQPSAVQTTTLTDESLYL